MRTFISEDLALTISQSREFLLRYTWQPSVLLMEMVGTLPITCRGNQEHWVLASGRTTVNCGKSFPCFTGAHEQLTGVHRYWILGVVGMVLETAQDKGQFLSCNIQSSSPYRPQSPISTKVTSVGRLCLFQFPRDQRKKPRYQVTWTLTSLLLIISTMPTTSSNTRPSFLQLSRRRKGAG